MVTTGNLDTATQVTPGIAAQVAVAKRDVDMSHGVVDSSASFDFKNL